MIPLLRSDIFREGEIEGVSIRELRVYSDNRGWLSELFRKDGLLSESTTSWKGFEPLMGYISMTHPDVTRGPHEHKEQTDYFCFLGNFKLYLWDNRKDSSTYKNKKVIHISERLIVIVPPNVVHAYKNIGDKDGIVINLPDRLYAGWDRKEAVDEIRYEDDIESPFKIEDV